MRLLQKMTKKLKNCFRRQLRQCLKLLRSRISLGNSYAQIDRQCHFKYFRKHSRQKISKKCKKRRNVVLDNLFHYYNYGYYQVGTILQEKLPTSSQTQIYRTLQRQNFCNRCFQHHLLIPRQNNQYPFLHEAYSRNSVNIPTDSQGNMTGHLIGLLYRALLVK